MIMQEKFIMKMKIKKYEWLNNPPKQLVKNLISIVKKLKQPGDDVKFVRLRETMNKEIKS